jgi:lysophospholipase L1-like esterase
VVAEMFGEEFSPDVAFVYFGWNDHWHAYGAIDADKVVRVPATKGGAARILDHLYQRLRVLQRVNSVLQRTHDAAPPLSVPRVPPEHYRANLRRIKEVFDRRQTPVVFITAPTSMYQTGVPGNLVGLRFASSKEEVLTSHREYNAIVREVAAQTGAHLLDLEAELAVLRNPRSVFTEDGIHFTPDGYAVVAKRVADIIDTNVRKPEAKTDTPKPDAPKADAPDGGQAPK